MATTTQRVVALARKRGVTVYTHRQWGSRRIPTYLLRRRSKRALEPADTVVQHITVTLDTGPLSGHFKTDMRTVERIGYERFQSGVSYNFVVDMETGEVGVGMPLDVKGTHTINDKGVAGFSFDQNYAARAIAVLGMENTPLSKKAEHSIAVLLACMVEVGAITDTFDYEPHSTFAWKSCPCEATRSRMPAIRKAALAMVNANPSPPKKATPGPVARSRMELAELSKRQLAVSNDLLRSPRPGVRSYGGKVKELTLKLEAVVRALDELDNV